MLENPALTAFVAAVQTELVFGQVLISRGKSGFELRHVADRQMESSHLRHLSESDLRPLAQFSEAGFFRPLKSAPNLKRGWRAEMRDAGALGVALDHLYPGAVADWFAARLPQPPVTSYRDFTGRQTGMYRITTTLDDATAGAVVRACCHAEFCLKRRLWSVGQLAVDKAGSKSVIPCLEPCAILLEFARKMARLEKDQALNLSEPVQIKSADSPVLDTDFDSPNNPRRARFILEKSNATGTPPVE
jgi:hypothetical protein